MKTGGQLILAYIVRLGRRTMITAQDGNPRIAVQPRTLGTSWLVMPPARTPQDGPTYVYYALLQANPGPLDWGATRRSAIR